MMPPYREFLERKGAKFKLVKTTINAKSFICRLSHSISNDIGTIRS